MSNMKSISFLIFRIHYAKNFKTWPDLRFARRVSRSDIDDPRDMEDRELRVCSLPASEILLRLGVLWSDVRISGRNCKTNQFTVDSVRKEPQLHQQMSYVDKTLQWILQTIFYTSRQTLRNNIYDFVNDVTNTLFSSSDRVCVHTKSGGQHLNHLNTWLSFLFTIHISHQIDIW